MRRLRIRVIGGSIMLGATGIFAVSFYIGVMSGHQTPQLKFKAETAKANPALAASTAIAAKVVRALPENQLGCDDFSNILNFIQDQHLRFDGIKPEDRKKFMSEAFNGMGDAYKQLGYPMMAAQTEKKLVPEWRRRWEKAQSPLDSAAVCKIFNGTWGKSIFLKSYARNLDAFSDFYLSEELDAKSSALDGEFVGIGVATETQGRGLGLMVTEVIEGGPADKKILVNDHILKIDGRSVENLTEKEITQRIRGEVGSNISLDGLRANKPFNITLVRDRVTQKSVSYAWTDNDLLEIKIHRFFRQTAHEVEEIVTSQGPKAKGFILDLRNNPGGLLQGARDVVDLFIAQGVVVYLKGRAFDDQLWALREGGETTKPVVVLVNENTASAAEIVAGALQDYGRAVVVGRPMYGKNSVQNIYETQAALSTHYRGGLKLTTLWYFLPSGRNVRDVKPDLELADADDKTEDRPQRLPYMGPHQIDVVPLSPQNLAKKWNPKSVADSIKHLADFEIVGKEVLKRMLATASSSR